MNAFSTKKQMHNGRHSDRSSTEKGSLRIALMATYQIPTPGCFSFSPRQQRQSLPPPPASPAPVPGRLAGGFGTAPQTHPGTATSFPLFPQQFPASATRMAICPFSRHLEQASLPFSKSLGGFYELLAALEGATMSVLKELDLTRNSRRYSGGAGKG